MERTRWAGGQLKRRMLATGACMVVSATAIATLSAPAGASAAGSARAGVTAARGTQSLAWKPCQEDPAVECATLAVPIDWARPDGPSIDLALAKRKATDPAARVGSLVINPGGPGGSGVDAVLRGQRAFSEDLRRRFDLVGFDPRGIARSHPVICTTSVGMGYPSTDLTSQADYDAVVAYNRKLAADCRERTGPLFDHVDTLSVVHDLDAIRQAVGDRKLTYYGVSYGTLIGQLYAETFGDRTRALIVDSNMDHSVDTGAFLNTETAFVQDMFNEFVAWCDRTAACPLRARGTRTVFTDLKARAARGELIVKERVEGVVQEFKIGPATLQGLVLSASYGPAWADLADIYAKIDSGEVIAAAATQASTAASAGSLGARTHASIGDTLRAAANGRTAFGDPAVDETFEQPMSVFCEDYALPIRDYREYTGYIREMNRIAPDTGPSPMAMDAVMTCLGWPGKVNNPQHPLRVRHSPKLVMTNSLHDPATGYAWAANAARQLGDRAVLVTYEGWGHGVYGRSPCTTGQFDSYLINLTIPAKGSRCPAVEPSDKPSTGSADDAAETSVGSDGSTGRQSLGSGTGTDVTAGAADFDSQRNRRRLPGHAETGWYEAN